MRLVSMTAWFDEKTLDQLTMAEPRLPALEKWLMEEVWTMARFHANDMVPSHYLKSGESLVNEMECMLTATADSYFGELCALPTPTRTVADFFALYREGCALILDGCSLREMPRLRELADISRRPVMEAWCSRSAIPSTTERFVGERLGLGLPVIAPSRLTSRRELREKNIRFHFFHGPNEHQTISDDAGHVLMWHRFPDGRFMDSTASTVEFFDGIWDTLEIVWKKTVQAFPPSRPVLVTSDHGYVYLGPGLSDRSLDGKDRALNGKRSREFAKEEPLPTEAHELFVDRERRLAAIKGRCHNRPQAPSPAQSVYRHEGISLMEVLTPWLILGPMEV
jgi:hypothetical protein